MHDIALLRLLDGWAGLGNVVVSVKLSFLSNQVSEIRYHLFVTHSASKSVIKGYKLSASHFKQLDGQYKQSNGHYKRLDNHYKRSDGHYKRSL